MFPGAPDDACWCDTAYLLVAALCHVDEAVLIASADANWPDARIVYSNPAFTRITGFSADEVLGRTPRLLQGPKTDRTVVASLRLHLLRGEPYAGSTINYRKDGTPFQCEWRTAPVRDPTGKVTHFVAVQRDVSERVRLEHELSERISQLTFYRAELDAQRTAGSEVGARAEAVTGIDALTGLKSRRAFWAQMDVEMARALRYNSALSVLIVDIDGFREYDSSFGRAAADEALRCVAWFLQSTSRSCDIPARYSGDEFVVILTETDSAGACVMAERFRAEIESASWKHMPLTVSIGASTLTPVTQDARQLVAEADAALYAAKQSGRNRVIHFKDSRQMLLSLRPEATDTARPRSATNGHRQEASQPIIRQNGDDGSPPVRYNVLDDEGNAR
jgi:diguanylate cyclase (GGDEF)-like protein/PAS domain S-box-containing protein